MPRKKLWEVPMICLGCGDTRDILDKVLFSNCYKKKNRLENERKVWQARLEKMANAVKILKEAGNQTQGGIPPLTDFEILVWERASFETIGSLAERTGRTSEDIMVAYEHCLYEKKKVGIHELPLLRKKYRIHENED